MSQVGQGNIEAAHELLQTCDTTLAKAAHDPYEARGLIYAMLIDTDPKIAAPQLQKIHAHAEDGVPEHTENLLPLIRGSSQNQLLLLLEMAMPTLKELSYAQYKRFSANAAELIVFDQRVDIFEWVLHSVMTKDLYAHFEQPHRLRVVSAHCAACSQSCNIYCRCLRTPAAQRQPAIKLGLSTCTWHSLCRH